MTSPARPRLPHRVAARQRDLGRELHRSTASSRSSSAPRVPADRPADVAGDGQGSGPAGGLHAPGRASTPDATVQFIRARQAGHRRPRRRHARHPSRQGKVLRRALADQHLHPDRGRAGRRGTAHRHRRRTTASRARRRLDWSGRRDRRRHRADTADASAAPAADRLYPWRSPSTCRRCRRAPTPWWRQNDDPSGGRRTARRPTPGHHGEVGRERSPPARGARQQGRHRHDAGRRGAQHLGPQAYGVRAGRARTPPTSSSVSPPSGPTTTHARTPSPGTVTAASGASASSCRTTRQVGLARPARRRPSVDASAATSGNHARRACLAASRAVGPPAGQRPCPPARRARRRPTARPPTARSWPRRSR